MIAKHTPGPWVWINNWNQYSELVHYVMGEKFPNGEPKYIVVHTDGSAAGEYSADIDPKSPDGRLIAAAPDHSLIAAALINGARWEPWEGSDGRGEFCVNGMRYSTRLDEFGVPEVHSVLRAAIEKATA